jgi:hypothetical protein
MVEDREIQRWEAEKRFRGYLFVINLIAMLIAFAVSVGGGLYIGIHINPLVGIGVGIVSCLLVFYLFSRIASKIMFKTGK